MEERSLLPGTMLELSCGQPEASCWWRKDKGKLKLSCVLGMALFFLPCDSGFGINVFVGSWRAGSTRAVGWEQAIVSPLKTLEMRRAH